MKILLSLLLVSASVFAQEANSGFELRTNVSAAAFYSEELGQPPRDGSEMTGGFRALFYPTWKIDSHWTIAGAVQVYSRPYFEEQFGTQGYGVKADVLQLNLGYSHFWSGNRSVVVRVGQLTSAFGSFLQRYDPTENTVIGIPAAYGYYYKPVTFLGQVGAQVDATAGKFDARAQFVNSSPVNPRGITQGDQYGTWAGGAGYTLRQGFRVGGSAFYGPYLDRQYAFYFPGEAPPKNLPAYGIGLDAEWGWRHWNVWAEWQRFEMEYRAIPNFIERTGYAEVRRVLSPRWYASARIGALRPHGFPGSETYEFAAGYRPGAHQLIKFGYTVQHGAAYPGTLGNVAAVEFTTSLPTLSFSRN